MNAAGGDVDNIAVSCLNTASIVVTVTGLLSGASLTLSDGVTLLPVAANGTSAFPGLLAPETAYAVTITVQPAAPERAPCPPTQPERFPRLASSRRDCGLPLTRYFRFRSSPPM